MNMNNAIKKFVNRWGMEVIEDYKIEDITIPMILNGTYAIFINTETELIQKKLDKWLECNYPDNGLKVISITNDIVESLSIITEVLVGQEDLSSWNCECEVFRQNLKEWLVQ